MKNNIFKEVHITELFDIKGTKTTSIAELKKYKKGNLYPYISTKSKNEGVDGFFNYFTEKGNVIVFDSATDGNIHYQKNNFSASDHVEKLIPKFNMTENIALYFVLLLKTATKGVFNYGYKLNQERMSKIKILVPYKDSNNVDYEYMEQTIKHLKNKKIKNYLVFSEKKITNLQYKKIEPLENKNWKSFNVYEIFENINRGKRLTEKEFIYGDMPFISSSSLNNGINAFVGNKEDVRIYDSCLTLANSGSVGSTFYHEYSFVASDHVTQLKNCKFNKYIYLFIATLIKRFGEKYYFNREISNKRLKRERILLPIKKDGTPDYQYMEQYIKNIMYIKYTKYFEKYS